MTTIVRTSGSKIVVRVTGQGVQGTPGTNVPHAASHEVGGGDVITVENLFTASTNTTFVFKPDGANGLVFAAESGGGGTVGFAWSFSLTTAMADPGSGVFRLNNADQTLATQMALSDITTNGLDVGDALSNLRVGDFIYVQESANTANFNLYQLTGTPVDNTTWHQLPITFNNGGAALTAVLCGFALARGTNVPDPHAASHSLGGSDQVSLENLHTATVVTTQALFAAGANAAAFRPIAAGDIPAAALPAHATRHEAPGADPITGTALELTQVVTNYTPSSGTLGGHVSGIDAALGVSLLLDGSRVMTGALDMGTFAITNVGLVDGVTVSAHAARHVFGGADAIDADVIDVTFVPVNYTRTTAPVEVTNVRELTAHLGGIDIALAAVGGGLATRYKQGIAPAWTSVTTVTLSIGSARSDDDTFDIALGSAQAVVITTGGANGLDTGSEASDTWYAVWVIGDSTLVNATAGLLSVSFSAPTLPGTHDKKRLVGAVRNNASSNFLEYRLDGDRYDQTFWYDEDRNSAPQRVLSGGSASSFTSVDCSDILPPVDVEPVFLAQQASASVTARIRPNGETDASGTTIVRPSNTMQVRMLVTDQTIQYQAIGGGGSLNIDTIGFRMLV